MVQTTDGFSPRKSGGESRSGKHNPLVLGSNPSGPTIFQELIERCLNSLKTHARINRALTDVVIE